MSEIKAIRLAAAATQYNVGMDHLVEKLKESGLVVENKPTTKLTVDMILVLEKAFKGDRAIKAEADHTIIDKQPKDIIEAKQVSAITSKKKEEEKEVLIKSNTAAPPPKEIEKPVVEKKIEEPIVAKVEPPKLEGPKVIGKVDLEKRPVKKVEEPVIEKVVETLPPPPPPVVETEAEKQEVKRKKDAPVEEEVKFMERKKIELTGPKVMGKIEIKDYSTPPKKKEEPPVKPKETTPSDNDPSKRPRKRIVPERTKVQDDPLAKKPSAFKGTGNNRPIVKANQTAAPGQIVEISEKEIEDKIKATMAKIQGQSNKSDRSKFRRGKREAIAEKLAQEQDELKNSKLQVTEFISVSELASLMNVSAVSVIQICMNLGVIVSINQRLDAEIIELVAGENGFEVEFISVNDQTSFEDDEVDDPNDLLERAPIVTIMGHVDHGKTSLLDYIRKTNVAGKEAGGITQHIGAYDVLTTTGKRISFLDTPGHEAFTAMRARGAKVTDIAVIVVAADDSVMPQTKEAINHAQSANVPMIFAINKIDKDGASPERIKEQLSAMNILVEDCGGKFQSQELSAKKGENVDLLLDKILLEAELLELKANPKRHATGSVIEASLDKGRGYIATLLVQNGTLELGDMIVAGSFYGKVKAMFDHTGTRQKTAGPSIPVQVLGLNGAPQAGEKFKVFDSEQDAKLVAQKRSQLEREQGIRTKKHITLDEIGRRLALGTFKELNLIIKGDVDGSVEALADSLLKLSTDEIHVRVIHKGVGAITESDVLLATASDAIVIGFNVRPSVNARKIAETENIEIRMYSIIYAAIDEVKSAMEGMLEPKIEEKVVANIEIREVFNITKVGTIAGCYVKDGKVQRSSKVRVVRDGIVIHTGTISALKRFKDDAKEVSAGMECGLQIKDYQNLQVNDTIEAFEEIEVQRKL